MRSARPFSGGAATWTRQQLSGEVAAAGGCVVSADAAGAAAIRLSGNAATEPGRSPSGWVGSGTGTAAESEAAAPAGAGAADGVAGDAPAVAGAAAGAAGDAPAEAPAGPPGRDALVPPRGSGMVLSTATASGEGVLSTPAGAWAPAGGAPLRLMVPPEAVVPTGVPGAGVAGGVPAAGAGGVPAWVGAGGGRVAQPASATSRARAARARLTRGSAR